MTYGRTRRVVFALRPAHRGHVGFHQLRHHLQPGTDRERQQPLLHVGDLLQRHAHRLRQRQACRGVRIEHATLIVMLTAVPFSSE
jgi:hypothetical protein